MFIAFILPGSLLHEGNLQKPTRPTTKTIHRLDIMGLSNEIIHLEKLPP